LTLGGRFAKVNLPFSFGGIMFSDKEMDLWIENSFNVLFQGRHGVGKTAVIIEAFNRHNLKWKYFSAATMDPWVDFVGVPKDTVDENGMPVLDLVRPRGFHNGEVEAIFMDELNRAPKKVRNAVMELIQFKSINGVKFPNLRFIWAAINPEDDEAYDTKYDVEKLDPAQKDRFHIIVDVPYRPVPSYFSSNYGNAGEGAIDWWNSLSDKEKELVSPRRLEYVIKIWQAGGNVRHVLQDKNINIHKLITLLDSGSKAKTLKTYVTASDEEKVKVFTPNFVNMAYNDIIKDSNYLKAYGQFLPKEKLSDTLRIAKPETKIIANSIPEIVEPIIKSIIDTGIKGAKLKKMAETYGDHVTKFLNTTQNMQAVTLPASSALQHILESMGAVNMANANVSVVKNNTTLNILHNLKNNQDFSRLNIDILRFTTMFIGTVVSRTQLASLTPGVAGIGSDLYEIIDIVKDGLLLLNIKVTDFWSEMELEMRTVPNKRQYIPYTRKYGYARNNYNRIFTETAIARTKAMFGV